ncbi:MAG: lysine--tRNA ligase [Deltaproteobacteria bacterium]|nr:lysine--tRNA ligase [Deltaproteobacteria bacterium]MBN2846056.1 lysine--tRNA ligase [Deltaproteobacteria bacterium]
MDEKSDLIQKKREKIVLMKSEGIALYPNDVTVTATTETILNRFGDTDKETLDQVEERFALAGRIMAVRNFGKSAFINVQDRGGKIQAYIAKNRVGDNAYSLFKKLDIGDIVSFEGKPFKTRTGELTIEAYTIRLLSKSVRPLPEKWHGLTDVETRYRQRHLDLIMNPNVKKVFYTRSRIMALIRDFMQKRDFLEVETPMMHPIAGGAMAQPFKTHHNALGMDLYLRIAPELYLKRLVVGGMERVYEINRNFRNEGISTFHNPEFSMMEFYQAYATYEDLIIMTEELFTFIAKELFDSLIFTYQGCDINLTRPWQRLTVKEAIVKYSDVRPEILEDRKRAVAYGKGIGLPLDDEESLGKAIIAIFEELVEDKLIQPTFITEYPLEVSPLSRKSEKDSTVVDRFELYISGKEIANAFSELNDPEDQRERFVMQLKEREAGDKEAHEMDEDYIRALEYGMAPTAGEGIGIDRLVMLFTDSPSIRDVILFPHMRSKNKK